MLIQLNVNTKSVEASMCMNLSLLEGSGNIFKICICELCLVFTIRTLMLAVSVYKANALYEKFSLRRQANGYRQFASTQKVLKHQCV